MLCFCILKRIGIATLFSQLWKLNNFEKKSSKKVENFLIFESSIFFENFQNIEKISKKISDFSIENHIENQKFENFEI